MLLDAALLGGGAGAEPDVLRGLVGAVDDLGDVAQEDRLAVLHAHHQLAHVLGGFEVSAGLHQHFLVARDQAARRLRGVGELQCAAQILGSVAVSSPKDVS